jgi:hypothetical protein
MSSEVKANKISPATGVTTTLGDASDVFQLPASAEIDIASGATLDVNGTIDVTGATVTGLSAGKVLQVVTATYSTNTEMSSTSYATSGLACSITPASTSNKVLVLYSGMCRTYDSAGNSGRWASVRLYRVTDTTQISAQTTDQVSAPSDNEVGFCWTQNFTTLDSPATSSSVEYRIDGKVLNSNMRLAMNNQASNSTLTLLEIEG